MSETHTGEENIALEILTPGRMVAQLSVPMVTLPGMEGYFGVLPGHMPLITRLKPGVITYEEGGMPRRVAVSTAVVEVIPERVIVLARSAELAGKLNPERVNRALEEARAKLASLAPGAEGIEEAQADLERAQARQLALEEEG